MIKRCKYNPSFILYDDGRMFSEKRNIFLKTRERRHGYLAYLFRDLTENKEAKITISNKINRVYISKKGVRRAFSIHRLLAEHFIPNPNNYPEVNHKNGIKTDNRLENLEWCTHSYNCKHAVNTGLHKMRRGKENKLYGIKRDRKIVDKIRASLLTTLKNKGENHHNVLIEEKNVLEIKKLLKEGQTHKNIASLFNVSVYCVSDISRGRSWKHLSDQ
jgi:hypothetical protein